MSRRKPLLVAVVFLVVASVLSGCDIVVNWDDNLILNRDGGTSAGFDTDDDGDDDISFWAFGDTFTSVDAVDGDRLVANTVALTSDLDASNGVCLPGEDCPGWEHPNPDGPPTEALPLSIDEQWFNGNAGCGDRPRPEGTYCFELWASDVVPDPARNRVLFWFVGFRRPTGAGIGDLEDYTHWRTGMVIWNQDTGTWTRPESRPTNPIYGWDDYALFDKNAEVSYHGGLVDDGYLYAWMARRTDPDDVYSTRCFMARAPLDNAHMRNSWTFFDRDSGDGAGWSTDYQAADPILASGDPDGLSCIAPQRTFTYNGRVQGVTAAVEG